MQLGAFIPHIGPKDCASRPQGDMQAMLKQCMEATGGLNERLLQISATSFGRLAH